jgi:hypothetical protein
MVGIRRTGMHLCPHRGKQYRMVTRALLKPSITNLIVRFRNLVHNFVLHLSVLARIGLSVQDFEVLLLHPCSERIAHPIAPELPDSF